MDENKKKKLLIKFCGIVSFPVIIAAVVEMILLFMVSKGRISVFISTIIIIAVVLAGLAFVAEMFGKIIKSLVDVLKNLSDIAEGNYNYERSEILRKNEDFGEILNQLETVIVQFAKIVSGIKNASGELDKLTDSFGKSFEVMHSSTDQANGEVQNIVENTLVQADMTEEFIDKTSAMTSSIEDIVGKINELTVSAKKMQQYNSSSKEIMDELVSITKENGMAVESIKSQTQETNKSAQEILEAVDLISSIANQTNLLSLNASIEAARAGEQGKGFAVVAEEIGKLAIESKESSEKISSIVANLVRDADNSVEATDKVVESFSLQKEKINDTEKIFEQLNNEVSIVTESLSQVNNQADTIQMHNSVMSESMAKLNETVNSNVKSADETSNVMNELLNMVNKCEDSTTEIEEVSKELISYINNLQKKASID